MLSDYVRALAMFQIHGNNWNGVGAFRTDTAPEYVRIVLAGWSDSSNAEPQEARFGQTVYRIVWVQCRLSMQSMN
jgi:hypothetical protein